LQQPVGQLVELHDVPDWQLPEMQVGVPPLHAEQAAPPLPHWPFVCEARLTQMPPLQHPAQLDGLHAAGWHAPPEHRSPALQLTHAAPLLPHAAGLVPGWQLLSASRQPVVHGWTLFWQKPSALQT
jgi:hypothetical protein